MAALRQLCLEKLPLAARDRIFSLLQPSELAIVLPQPSTGHPWPNDPLFLLHDIFPRLSVYKTLELMSALSVHLNVPDKTLNDRGHTTANNELLAQIPNSILAQIRVVQIGVTLEQFCTELVSIIYPLLQHFAAFSPRRNVADLDVFVVVAGNYPQYRPQEANRFWPNFAIEAMVGFHLLVTVFKVSSIIKNKRAGVLNRKDREKLFEALPSINNDLTQKPLHGGQISVDLLTSRLPLELQEMVFSHVVPSTFPTAEVQLDENGRALHKGEDNVYDYPIVLPDLHFLDENLLLVNKHIRNVALGVIHKQTALELRPEHLYFQLRSSRFQNRNAHNILAIQTMLTQPRFRDLKLVQLTVSFNLVQTSNGNIEIIHSLHDKEADDMVKLLRLHLVRNARERPIGPIKVHCISTAMCSSPSGTAYMKCPETKAALKQVDQCDYQCRANCSNKAVLFNCKIEPYCRPLTSLELQTLMSYPVDHHVASNPILQAPRADTEQDTAYKSKVKKAIHDWLEKFMVKVWTG